MSCLTIDASILFDAIRNKEDEYWKSAAIISMDIPLENRLKLADKLIKDKKAQDWFVTKLWEYENGGDDYA